MAFGFYPEGMAGEWLTFEPDPSPEGAVDEDWLLEEDNFILEEE